MPELPEVETIVRQLNREIKGKTITDFICNTPKMLATHKLADFQKQIRNKKILNVKRRGKIILLELSGNLILAAHLRLTGQLFIRKATDPSDRFNRAIFKLGKNLELRFNDLRKFGQIWLLPKDELAQDLNRIQKLGPEPLDRDFTFEKFKKIIQDKKTKIKTLLMDQTKISGIGNIYSDEALFYAGIHPLTQTRKIPLLKLKKLYQGIKKVLQDAIQAHGTSDQWYREAHGQKGEYQNKLKVYHRTGQPCVRCGTKIARVKIGGRSAHFCPKCQKPNYEL